MDSDLMGRIMDYEDGKLDEAECIALFQYLIDSGTAFQLQGSYGRTAHTLIARGLCKMPKRQKAEAP